MLKIAYSNEAEKDLEEIVGYIAQTSITNALAYLERYEERITLLAENPKMGTLCEHKNIFKSCRVLVSESHVIVYQENEAEIWIVRIFHQSVNYPAKV